MRVGLVALAMAIGVAGCAAPAKRADWVDPAVADTWLKADGTPDYPPDQGFLGAPTPIVLPPGVLLDRYGGDGGQFLSPRGAAYEARALPGKCQTAPYSTFRVVTPLPVLAGPAAPWFGRKGWAMQVRTDAPVELLLKDRVIDRVVLPPLQCP